MSVNDDEVGNKRISITRALRADIHRRFISTHELWPTGRHLKTVFWITEAEGKKEFSSEFFHAFGHHFGSDIHLIDVKDNCLVLSVCKDNNSMWLPRESLCLIRNFYNQGYPTKLGLQYVGEGLFFAVARDSFDHDLEIMYQDKYVGDVLSHQFLNRIKEVFRLDYSDSSSETSNIQKSQPVAAENTAGAHMVGDGESIDLDIGKSYSTSSRIYLPIQFARLLLPAGLGSFWTVIGPNKPTNNRFKFKFVRNSSQSNAYLFAVGWREFCNAYKGTL